MNLNIAELRGVEALVSLLAIVTKNYTSALLKGVSGPTLDEYCYLICVLKKEIEMRKKGDESGIPEEEIKRIASLS